MPVAMALPATMANAPVTPDNNRTQPNTIRSPVSADIASVSTETMVLTRIVWSIPNRRITPFRAERTRQITGGVDGVHDAGHRIRPAEAVAHVGQNERIRKATNTNSDRWRDRKKHDLPNRRSTDRLIFSIRFQDALLSALPLSEVGQRQSCCNHHGL